MGHAAWTALDDNIVWGTADDADNIVWGTSGEIDNIVWGTSSESDNMTWGNSGEDTPLFDDPDTEPANFDQTVWENIFPTDPVQVVPVQENLLQPILSPVTSTVTSVTGLLGGGF